jgi:hypothetical protein
MMMELGLPGCSIRDRLAGLKAATIVAAAAWNAIEADKSISGSVRCAGYPIQKHSSDCW